MRHTVRKPRRRERIVSRKVVDRRDQVWEGLLGVAGDLMAGNATGFELYDRVRTENLPAVMPPR